MEVVDGKRCGGAAQHHLDRPVLAHQCGHAERDARSGLHRHRLIEAYGLEKGKSAFAGDSHGCLRHGFQSHHSWQERLAMKNVVEQIRI